MRRRSRLLRVAKWGGTLMCALCLIGFKLGTPAIRYIWSPASGKGAGVWVGADGIGYASFVAIKIELVARSVYMPSEPIGWSFGHALDSLPIFGVRAGTYRGRVLGISSAFFAILIGTPTALFWYLDRHRPLPGHCPCGYDLRGNVSGTCPECGRPMPTDA